MPTSSALPQQLSALLGATLPDGRLVDVEISGTDVVAVHPAGTLAVDGRTDASVLDLTGYLLLTAPADPHAHLDKARSWDAIRPPMGDLRRAIESWRVYTGTMDEQDVVDRARAQALAMLANGTTAVRSHVDVLRAADGNDPLTNARALVRVREELAGLVDLELVALAGPEVQDTDVEAVLDLGVDLVGGAPHLAEDASADLQRLLAVAHRRGAGVDLHTDEGLDGPLTLGELARTVRGWTQNVSAGHCVRLGTLPAAQRAEVVADVVASRVGVIANPLTNLYLQGWDHDHSAPRGLTAARDLVDAGARFAAGGDNVRDPFNPLGRGDAFETAVLLVAAGHLTVDEAWHAVSDGAREVMGLPAAGVVPGRRAELLAVLGGSLPEVVADAPATRHVVHAGRLVASSSLQRVVAAPRAPVTAGTDLGPGPHGGAAPGQTAASVPIPTPAASTPAASTPAYER